MIWLQIAGAVLCWLVALGAFFIFFLLLEECWHRGRQGLRIGHEVAGAVIFFAMTFGALEAGIALLPDKESWKAAMNTPTVWLSFSAHEASPIPAPCASNPR